MVKLEDIDWTILMKLCNNCRVSYEQLARDVGLSPNAVKNRVSNLIDSGIVHKFHTILDQGVIGANHYQAIVITDGLEDIDEFVNNLGNSPLVGHISILASPQGGAYLVWGQYIGVEGLRETTTLLRASEHAENVDFHTLTHRSPKRTPEFTNLHLRVLRCLVDAPQQQLSEISKRLKIAPKTARRALREIIDSEQVKFIARPDLAAGGLVNIHIRLMWDEKLKSLEEIISWINDEFPFAFWHPWASAVEPVLFAEFVIRNLHEAERIAKQVRRAPFVNSSTTLVSYSNAKFQYLSEILLIEMLDKAGV